MSRWFVLPVALISLALIAPTPVAAQPGSSTPPTTAKPCEEQRVLCAGLGSVAAQPATQRAPAAPKRRLRRVSRGHPSLYRRDRFFLSYDLTGGPPTLCTTADGEPGWVYRDRVIYRETGEVVDVREGCERVDEPRRRVTRAESAPPVTPRRVWDVVPLPQPDWGMNPEFQGLTGLETWLWDPNGDAPVSAAVTLDGFTYQVSARPVRWEWRMWERGDTPNRNPSPLVVATQAGTEQDPAGKYMYETRGDYTMTLTVYWAGTSTFTGPGVSDTVDLGTTTTSSSRRYRVISVAGARVG